MAVFDPQDPSKLDHQIVGILQRYAPELWGVTIVFFVFGDLLTTSVGLLGGGVAEVGPLVGPLLDRFGLLAMIPLKALAVGTCYGLWKVIPEPHSIGVPLGLATFGVLVTGWNTFVLFVAFS